MSNTFSGVAPEMLGNEDVVMEGSGFLETTLAPGGAGTQNDISMAEPPVRDSVAKAMVAISPDGGVTGPGRPVTVYSMTGLPSFIGTDDVADASTDIVEGC